jgi:hypothetical protein
MNIKDVRKWAPYVAVVLILAAACFATGNALADRSTVQAQAISTGDIAAPQGYGGCIIQELAQLDTRMHVKCQANYGGIGPTIVYFSVPTNTTTEIRQANRYMSLLMTAWAFSRQPIVAWEDNTAANPPGCLAQDCRRLTQVKLQ